MFSTCSGGAVAAKGPVRCPVEHKAVHAIRILDHVGHRDPRAPRHCKEREAVDAGRTNDGFKVLNQSFKCELDARAIGEADPAKIIGDQRVSFCQG